MVDNWGDLAGNEGVRDLLLPAIGTRRTIGRQQPVEGAGHCGLGIARLERHDGLGKRAVAIDRLGKGLTAHPDNTEQPCIRYDLSRRNSIDMLRRQGDPDDPQLLPSAMQCQGDVIPNGNAVRAGEGVEQNGLVPLAAARQTAF